jgi:hypothetical protein
MRTWIITARTPTGEELPIGLAEASSEAAALFRALSKVASLRHQAAGHEIIVRPADPDAAPLAS